MKLALVAIAVALSVLAFTYDHHRRGECRSAGGTYIRGHCLDTREVPLR